MDQDEIIRLNLRRIKSQLAEFFNQLTPELLERCKNLTFVDTSNLKSVSLDEIDFTKSCIFISDLNILPFVCIFALQKINNVLYPDTTLSGHFSRIRTDYFLAESTEIRYSKMDLSSVDLEEVPIMYKPTSFLYKDLCIWRCVVDVGQGENEKMWRFCDERLSERYFRNQNDWIFFVGTLDEFKSSYNIQLPYPRYVAIDKSTTDKTSTKSSSATITINGQEIKYR